MQKYKTWEDLDKINGLVRVTSHTNPYKEDTEEYIMIEYVCSLNGQMLLEKNQQSNSLEILKLYKEYKIFASIDPWYIYSLFPKAVWLARAAGCIQIEKVNDSPRLQFACYVESGMINYLESSQYYSQLATMPNQERREVLNKVLKVGNEFYNNFKIPSITYHGKSITINNLDQYKFENLESLPIQTWSQPCHEFVDLDSRGLFHHLGDDLAFLFAASEYGDAYIVGNDEFGDLIILATIPYKTEYLRYSNTKTKFKMGEVISSTNLDYLYGVPRANALYPTKLNNIFNYSTENTGYCKLNSEANGKISAYWNTDTFKKYAQRKIQSHTFTSFVKYIENQIFSVLNEEKYAKQKLALERFIFEFSQNLESNKNIINEVDMVLLGLSAVSPLPITRLDSQTKILNNDEQFEKREPVLRADFIKVLIKIIFKEKEISLDTYIKETIERILKIRDLESYPNIKQILESFYPKIQSLLISIENLKSWKDLNFNEDLYKALQFFYKTTSHKVHCEIINPSEDTQLGFFLKDGKNKHEINGNLIVSTLLDTLLKNSNSPNSFSEWLKEFLIKDLQNGASDKEVYKNLLEYWSTLDNEAFVVSEVIDMQNEYRIFVINHRPVSGSPCFRNSTPFDAYDNTRFNPRLCVGHSAYETFENQESRNRVAKYARFAREFCASLKIEKPESGNYVLDVAWSDTTKGVVAIEINTVSWSGAYQIDFRRVCAAVAKVPYHYSDMSGLGRYKELLAQHEPIPINNEDTLLDEEEIIEEDLTLENLSKDVTILNNLQNEYIDFTPPSESSTVDSEFKLLKKIRY